MSGILNKKQRIMDFSLTRNGYEQTQNGDLRIKYATFTDKDAIYDIEENSIDVADITSMPFNFEIFNTDLDVINPEIDLFSYVFDSNINNNIYSTFEYNSSSIDIINGRLIIDQSNTDEIEQIFSSAANSILSSIKKKSLILTDSFFNDSISLKVSKINDEILTLEDSENKTAIFNLNTLSNQLLNRLPANEYFTMSTNDIKIKNKVMFDDARFSKKLNYAFLPPIDNNENTIQRNNSSQNFYLYNFSEDSRDYSKIVYKELKNIRNSGQSNNLVDTLDSDSNMTILNSIKNLEILSAKTTEDGMANPNRLNSIELKFDQIEKNSPYMFHMYEKNEANATINKLVCLDHGEIFDTEKQKNVSVFLLGKIFHSKEDFDLYNESNENLIDNYINIDNYNIFVNLFTMVIE